MDKEDPNHDRLARRLTDILSRLNYGDTLDIDELALEYGVHRRTVQRDLHERFDFLPLEKKEGRYTLARSHLGCLGLEDIRRFAALAGLSGLFPALDKTFIREWLESRLQSVVDVHGVGYEDLGAKVNDFRTLQRAITQQHRVRFTYHKPESSKQVEAEPYRLINNTGLWYLAAVEVESGLPKSYALSKLTNPQGLDHVFSPEASVREMLDQEDSI
jgi:predicted DNA-binding transcriptional regulator YafY